IIEDLYWADDSTLALLDHLTRRLADVPLLLVATYRDSELDVAGGLARTLEKLLRERAVTHVGLQGLLPDEVAMMLRSLSGQDAPPALTSTILGETRGNPFFIEELFRYLEQENRLYDSEGRLRSSIEISEPEAPARVRLLVSRRLERVSDQTRKLLATAAVIGRSFHFEVLRCSSGNDADLVLDGLEEAEKAGLIFPVAEGSIPGFEFRHELTRQAVIAGMSVARRQSLHLKLGDTIEQMYQDTIEEHCSELAHHYGASSNPGKAVKYLHGAGLQAWNRGALKEAELYWRRGIAALSTKPETPERIEREFFLQLDLLVLLSSTSGYASGEAEEALERLKQISEQL